MRSNKKFALAMGVMATALFAGVATAADNKRFTVVDETSLVAMDCFYVEGSSRSVCGPVISARVNTVDDTAVLLAALRDDNC